MDTRVLGQDVRDPGGTGRPGHGSRDKTARKNSQKRTTVAGKRQQNGQNMTRPDSMTGKKPGQDKRGRRTMTVQPGQDLRYRTVGRGQSGQVDMTDKHEEDD
jgi:hypothetical protein